MTAKLSSIAGGQSSVVLFYALLHTVELAVSAGLNDLEVVSDEAGVPDISFAHGPDHPYLVGPVLNRLLDIGIGHKNGIEVGVAIDQNGWEPHRDRGAGNQVILRHHVRG